MTISQRTIDTLMTLGQQLQTSHSILDAAMDCLAAHDLENPFFDGVLTEKLNNLALTTLEALEFIGSLTRDVVELKTEQDITDLVNKALNTMGDIESGAIFGIPQPQACNACPAEADCPAASTQEQ